MIAEKNYIPNNAARVTVPFVCCSYTNSYGTLDPARYSSVSICDEGAASGAVKG